jgi:hypothetical protein
MAATGFAWFAGNFATVGPGPLDWLAAHGLYLYRGPLFHLVLSYPRGRLAGRVERSAVAVGYVAAIVTPASRNGTATIVLASLLVGVAGRSYLRPPSSEPSWRVTHSFASPFRPRKRRTPRSWRTKRRSWLWRSASSSGSSAGPGSGRR